MAFDAAGTATIIYRGRNQLQGLWSDIFTVTITGADPPSILPGAEQNQTYTVPGVVLGDMVIGISFSRNITIDADVSAFISAANTLNIRISNLDPTNSLNIASTTIKVIIARPSF